MYVLYVRYALSEAAIALSVGLKMGTAVLGRAGSCLHSPYLGI